MKIIGFWVWMMPSDTVNILVKLPAPNKEGIL